MVALAYCCLLSGADAHPLEVHTVTRRRDDSGKPVRIISEPARDPRDRLAPVVNDPGRRPITDDDVRRLYRAAREAWREGCNCALCFAVEKCESNRIDRDSLLQLLRVWADENGPQHVGTKWWGQTSLLRWS